MKLKLYSKPNCVYCDKVKSFIKENNIQSVEFDESANVMEVRKFDGMQFPMLKVTDENGGEQAVFESEVIIQIIQQVCL